ncbi:unnamed protein product [Amoebophrya sp. A120]|nr:unnamed protein product [Amoebophrya sp. A120]|eukprot:GSA120T00006081001.1
MRKINSLVAVSGLYVQQASSSKLRFRDDPVGIQKVRELLEKFKETAVEEGKEAAKLQEEKSCAYKELFDKTTAAITTSQGEYEAKEGVRQKDQSRWEFLTADAKSEGSIKFTKAAKASKEQELKDKLEEKKVKEEFAMKTMAEAQEGMDLIQQAKDSLQAATESVDSLQAFLQVKQKLRALSLLKDDVEQPEVHKTGHDALIEMLNDLKDDISDHFAQTRKEWTEEESELVKAIQALENKIAELKKKIEDDTEEMEACRSSVLKLDQEMHALKVQIETDTKMLKEATERMTQAKKEYDADEKTRLKELQVVSTTTAAFNEKFGAAPTPKPPAVTEEGEPEVVKCTYDPEDRVVDIPRVAMPKGKANAAVFLQRSTRLLQLKNDEDSTSDRSNIMSLLSTKAKELHSTVLISVMSSVRKDPLKKVRVMIANLIERLKTEAANELKRNTYCTTEETKLQDTRTKNKKDIVKYETGLEDAQATMAESYAKIEELEQSIRDAKSACTKANSQFIHDIHLHTNAKDVAEHGKESLAEVIGMLKTDFYGDSAQADVQSGYTGNTGGMAGIIGMMEGLQQDYLTTFNTAHEEILRLEAEKADMVSDSSHTIDDKRTEEEGVVSETLEPAIASFQANGKDLYETIQDYSGQTEQLIFLKYESEACADKQLSKEEEMENLEAEIDALKDALSILENHSA